MGGVRTGSNPLCSRFHRWVLREGVRGVCVGAAMGLMRGSLTALIPIWVFSALRGGYLVFVELHQCPPILQARRGR
jgi:hypothetical protein